MLAGILEDEDADVLVAYDEHGGLRPSRPRHGAPGRAACRRAGRHPSGCSWPPSTAPTSKSVMPSVQGTGLEVTPEMKEMFETIGVPGARVTTEIDVRELPRHQAVSHAGPRSQIGDTGFFLAMSDDVFTAVWGNEWYVRVRPDTGHRTGYTVPGRSGSPPYWLETRAAAVPIRGTRLGPPRGPPERPGRRPEPAVAFVREPLAPSPADPRRSAGERRAATRPRRGARLPGSGGLRGDQLVRRGRQRLPGPSRSGLRGPRRGRRLGQWLRDRGFGCSRSGYGARRWLRDSFPPGGAGGGGRGAARSSGGRWSRPTKAWSRWWCCWSTRW